VCRLAMRRVFFERRYQHARAWRSLHGSLHDFFRRQRFPVQLLIFFFVLSCCTKVPSRDTPAKMPRERDQKMISASNRMSVSAMLFGHGNGSAMVGWSGRCRVGAISRFIDESAE
jgi:hypothetical protein